VALWLAKRASHRSIASLRATLIAPITVLVYALHQDFWFWRSARPLVFGFLPIGLFYHAVYTAAISLFMWYVVRRSWPSHLEEANERQRMGEPAEAPRTMRRSDSE
jgi:hypothetical protein